MPRSERQPPPGAALSDRSAGRQALSLGSLILLVALGVGLCALYFTIEFYLLSGGVGFPLDDSWIHLQFARNLLSGNGLSINPGELVSGSTAPLWTALISLLFALPGSTLLWVKLAGVLLYLAGGFLTYRLALELEMSRGLAVLAAALTLATSWLVWSALSGLEIPLFVVSSVAGILLHLRERRDPARVPTALVVLALGCLVRPEGLLLWLLAAADRWLTFRRDYGVLVWCPPRRPAPWPALVACSILVVPMLLFNQWAAGSLLPTTFGAKSEGMVRWLPELGYLYTVLGILFQAQPWMTVLAGAGVLVLLGRLGGKQDRGLLPALWLLALPIAYGLIDPPGKFNLVGNFGRYFFPLFPVVAVLGVLGVDHCAARMSRWLRIGGRHLSLRVVLVAVLVLPTLVGTLQGGGRYGQSVLNVEESDVLVAGWLSERVSPEALLAVADIGALKYLLPNRVVDLAGIANPEVRRWGAERFVQHYRPDYVVIFPSWLRRLFPQGPPFELVREFPIANNITMGGDLLAVYSTPWTRYPLTEPRGLPDAVPEG